MAYRLNWPPSRSGSWAGCPNGRVNFRLPKPAPSEELETGCFLLGLPSSPSMEVSSSDASSLQSHSSVPLHCVHSYGRFASRDGAAHSRRGSRTSRPRNHAPAGRKSCLCLLCLMAVFLIVHSLPIREFGSRRHERRQAAHGQPPRCGIASPLAGYTALPHYTKLPRPSQGGGRKKIGEMAGGRHRDSAPVPTGCEVGDRRRNAPHSGATEFRRAKRGLSRRRAKRFQKGRKRRASGEKVRNGVRKSHPPLVSAAEFWYNVG